jgi:hypothetical protein
VPLCHWLGYHAQRLGIGNDATQADGDFAKVGRKSGPHCFFGNEAKCQQCFAQGLAHGLLFQ